MHRLTSVHQVIVFLAIGLLHLEAYGFISSQDSRSNNAKGEDSQNEMEQNDLFVGGDWYGKLGQPDFKIKSFDYELHLEQSGKIITGYSIIRVPGTSFIGQMRLEGYLKGDNQIDIQEKEITIDKHGFDWWWCLKSGTLSYFSVTDSLAGNWTASGCTPGIISLKRKEILKISTFTDNVPYFVTGYWQPTTTNRYLELERTIDRLRTKECKSITLRDIPGGYAQFCPIIDSKFDEICRQISLRAKRLLVKAKSDRTLLHVLIVGYVDPLNMTPCIYSGESVLTTKVITPDQETLSGSLVVTGSNLSGVEGNIKLSHLRSYYVFKEIEERMQSDKYYSAMKKDKRLEIKYCGGGIIPGEYKGEPLKRKFTIWIY